MVVRVRIQVRGRVQGVCYRAATRDEARARGLTGWVCNLPDGSVLLEAQGTEAEIEALVAWCQRGPPAARVVEVDREKQPPIAGESSFEVRRG